MQGAKGSVRDIRTFVCQHSGQEYVIIGGCDRHLRLFDPSVEYQKQAPLAHCYLKQKVNSFLVSAPE